MKRIFEFLIVLFVLFFGLFNGKIVFAESYLDEDLLMEYSQNSIIFPDNCSSGGGGGAGELEGKDNMERVWNWFVNAGIDGVSDNPAVIAGILGNLGKESGYNPFAKNSYGYYGLYQEDSAEMRKYVEEKVGSVEWGSSTDDAEKNSAAIAAELEWLQKHSDFKQFVKDLNAPENKSGVAGAKAYAELFLVRFERAVNGSDAIEDSGVADYMRKMYGGKTYLYQNASGRRDEAEKVYNYSQENGLGTKSGGSSSGDLPSCGGGNVKDSKNINATAVALAWPEGTPEKDYLYKQTNGKKGSVVYKQKLYSALAKDSGGPTEAFKEAFDELFPNPNWNPCSRVGASCDVFAATVVGYSGYDKKFPRALEKVLNHARNSDLWEVISFNGDKEKVKGGDLLIRSSGHIAVAVRDEDDKLWVAQASLCWHWGYISDASVKNYQYIVRATKANNSTAGVSVKDGVANSNSAGKITKKGQGNGDIGASALELAWPFGTDEDTYKSKATDKFAKYYKEINPSNDIHGGRSCDRFVSTVVKYAGVDDDIPSGNAPNIQEYLAGSDLWEEVQMKDPKSTAEYQDGDVIAFGNDSISHVGIYVEDGGKGYIAQASYGGSGNPAYYGVVKDTNNITSSYFSTVKAYRNKNNKNATVDCDVCAGEAEEDGSLGDGKLKEGGYETVEEAEKAVMSEYRKYDGKWKLGTDKCYSNIDNCSTFSAWFVKRYLGWDTSMIPSKYPGGMMGKALASNLYQEYHTKYPKIKKSNSPSVYSVVSWNSSMPYPGGSSNHTGVVLGINGDKVLIGEAAWCKPSFTGVHVFKLSQLNGNGIYVDVRAYVKDLKE